MRRRDVAIGFAVGIALVGYIVLFGAGTFNPAGNVIEKVLFGWWPVGLAILGGAVVVTWRRRWPVLARMLGYVGVAWISFIAGYDALLLVFYLIGGGIY